MVSVCVKFLHRGCELHCLSLVSGIRWIIGSQILSVLFVCWFVCFSFLFIFRERTKGQGRTHFIWSRSDSSSALVVVNVNRVVLLMPIILSLQRVRLEIFGRRLILTVKGVRLNRTGLVVDQGVSQLLSGLQALDSWDTVFPSLGGKTPR